MVVVALGRGTLASIEAGPIDVPLVRLKLARRLAGAQAMIKIFISIDTKYNSYLRLARAPLLRKKIYGKSCFGGH